MLAPLSPTLSPLRRGEGSQTSPPLRAEEATRSRHVADERRVVPFGFTFPLTRATRPTSATGRWAVRAHLWRPDPLDAAATACGTASDPAVIDDQDDLVFEVAP